jgi:very-short-patch-repair endonuclease
MRAELNPAEAALWAAIRSKQLGVVFRRQVPLLGRFIADFYAPALRLVVEVDGSWHRGRESADAARDRKLRHAGYRVLRLRAELVMRELTAAVERVRLAIRAGKP